MTVGQKTVKETSMAKLFVLLVIILIAAVSIIQGAFLPGILAAVLVLLLYYNVQWVRQREDRRSRVDLMDERLVDLEKRVREIEGREGK